MLRLIFVFAGVALTLAAAVPMLHEDVSRIAHQTEQMPSAGNLQLATVPGLVVLRQGRDGHFRADAVINGRSIPVLVDTGATTVVLRYEDARNMGLVHPGDRYDIPVSTANGVAHVKRIRINSIRISGIVVHNVDGLVGQEGMLGSNLLGMSFLNKLRSFEIRNGNLRLEG